MGIVQKDAIRTSIISFVGLILGYLNKGLLFVLLFSRAQVGLVNLVMNVALLFAQFANLGTIYSTWRFFPFFENKEQIEVSKFYEKLPKPHALAVQEWLEGKVYHRDSTK